MAIYELLAYLFRRDSRSVAFAATAVCLVVPTILAAQNWDDHDRSGRTYARDVGYNYLMSTPKNAIIINYGDNDTFPLWYNQEVDGVRPDVRIMNSSYLSGDWYIDEMRTAANDAPPVPFSLPPSKYTYVNDVLPIRDRISRTVTIRELMDFIESEDDATKLRMIDDSYMDYVPARSIALPVNKDNAIASGIVKEEDRDKMVDTVYINISKRKTSLEKNEMMLLDMLATFDWNRPISFTQVYMLQDFGLLNYLQFDGYAYRLVPILTPYESSWDIGRIDTDVAYPLLKETFRYGNLADEDVLVDYFTQYNIGASKARESFARVARELTLEGRNEEALEMLDRGLEVFPINKIRFTDANTYPFIETYYALKEYEKGDALMQAYIDNLIEYIEYYLLFDGVKANLVTKNITDRMDSLQELYFLAAYAGRNDIVRELNEYYRTFGYTDDELIIPGSDSSELMDAPAVEM